MKLFKSSTCFIALVFVFKTTVAGTWETVTFGYWNQPGVWLGGIVPPYNCSDTIQIKHAVVLDATLTLLANAFLKIDSSGGICGHEKITVNSNARIIKYGILELDSLDIAGGAVNCHPPGSVVLTLNAILTISGSSFTSGGCSVAVGPWFNCLLPEYFFTGTESISENYFPFSLSPNPNTGSFTASFSENLIGKNLQIFSVLGTKVFQTQILCEESSINLPELQTGVYFCVVGLQGTNKIEGLKTQKLVILK